MFESFLSLVNLAPSSSATVILSVIAIAAAFILQKKKINIEENTSITSSQQVQIQSLMAQITMLSSELEKTREQLTELHNQNIELMKRLRDADHRIGELEDILNKK